MSKKLTTGAVALALAILLPQLSFAQGIAEDLHGLQSVLQHLYDEMMPLCKGMINVARGIAGFAALWYIGARIWKHVAAAEPVDIYPLFRPFVIGFFIMIFPSVLGLINGVLDPVVKTTNQMAQNSNKAVKDLLEDRKPGAGSGEVPVTEQGDPDKWYQYSHPDNVGDVEGNSNTILDAFSGFSLKNMIRKWIAELLNILFEAAALCLDTIRTFKLIVLAIIGPVCFGLSIFDGFQHTLKQWLARYVNVFMWLPIANIFGAIIGKIHENMIIMANSGSMEGNDLGNTNTAYLIFLLIGIVGYFTVPSVANYVMNVGGHALLSKASNLSSGAISYASGMISQNFTVTNSRNDYSASQNRAAGPGHGNKEKLSGKN